MPDSLGGLLVYCSARITLAPYLTPESPYVKYYGGMRVGGRIAAPVGVQSTYYTYRLE